MVQRKIPSNICIQKRDNLKSENQSGKLRPFSPRFQDGQNKGIDMKPKIMSSKSVKRSIEESFWKTPNIIKEIPQPGKPPTNENQNQKQKQIPNYMKSTSSFEARKEKSQVNSLTSTKTLTRISSLKKVTLKNTSSFRSKVVVSEDLNSQRATCSSTLKNLKFPNYLKLSHGATESKGTSHMKVCPYTYCSLNGDRHAPLPPLNLFLSAKRLTLKSQKDTKLGGFLPRKTKKSRDLQKEIFGEKIVTQESMVQEDQMDFYVEIFVDTKEIDSKNGSVSNQREMELNGTDSETYDIDWEEGQHPVEEREEYESENNSGVIEKNLNCPDEKIFVNSCFDEILVDETEEVVVQPGEDKNELIGNNDREISTKIYENCESIEKNTQVFEPDVCHEVLVGNLLADTKNAAENQILEQEVEEKKQIVDETNGELNEVFDDKIFISLDSIDSEDQTHPEHNKMITPNEINEINDEIQMIYSDNLDQKESSTEDKTQKRAKTEYTLGKGHSIEDLESNKINIQITKREILEDDLAGDREFDPREPNYLPITPDLEGEKIDLRHQDLDGRKNAEEWMIDYALQKTVNRLGFARKKKVALLVEAFEKVAPPHYTPSLGHSSSGFGHVRHIQACI